MLAVMSDVIFFFFLFKTRLFNEHPGEPPVLFFLFCLLPSLKLEMTFEPFLIFAPSKLSI